MFAVTVDATQLVRFLLLFCRIGGVMAVAPLLGSERVPARAKAALAIAIAVVLAPVAGSVPEFDSPITMSLAAAGEIMIGVAIGFGAKLIFSAINMAGELADLQSGFGFASMVSPQTGEHASVIGQLQMNVSWLIFLGANGHHLVLTGLSRSLSALPLGSEPGFCASTLTHAVSGLIASAVMLSAPIVGAVILSDLALGLLTRAAPQMNLLAVGFPIKLAVGLLATLLALPLLVTAEHGLLRTMEQIISSLLAEMRS
jgi:flagellar biosynthetic protein FliR